MATIQNLVSALVLYPEVQRRARAEIDAVIGRDRLPVPDDKQLLPYVEAVAREILRWQQVVPLGSCVVTLEFQAILKGCRTSSSPSQEHG